MATTPEMGLDLPVPGTTAGPTWANKLNTALTVVDGHDHSPGHGAAVSIENVEGAGTMAQQDANAVAITGGTVTGLPDPTSDQDAATKAYVDSHSGSTDDILPDAGAILVKFTTIPPAATPSGGRARVYVDQTSKALAVVNDAGVVSHTVQTKGATSHQFLTAIADDGTVSAAQPDFSDLTGSLPNDAPVAGDLLATAIAAPATPSTGKARIYVDSTSKNLAVKSSDGVVKHGVQTRNAATSIFLTGIGDDGQVTGAHPASTDLADATAAGIAMFEAANVAAQQALLGLGPFATGGISLAGQLYGSSTGNTLTANIYSNTVTYGQLQQASANVLLGHGPGGFVPLSTLSTPVAAGTSHEFMGIGSNTMTGSTRGYVPAACTITFLEVDPQGGGAPTVDTVFTIYKNGSSTAATVTQGAGGHSGSVIFSGTFGVLTFNGTTDTLDIVCTPSTGGGGAWNVACTVGADTTGAPGDVAEIPCTDAGRTIIAAADAAAQRTALGLGSLATASMSLCSSGNINGLSSG